MWEKKGFGGGKKRGGTRGGETESFAVTVL